MRFCDVRTYLKLVRKRRERHNSEHHDTVLINMTREKTIYFACDGFGEVLKDSVKAHVEKTHAEKSEQKIKIVDFGNDTYFDAAAKVGKALAQSLSHVSHDGSGQCLFARKHIRVYEPVKSHLSYFDLFVPVVYYFENKFQS